MNLTEATPIQSRDRNTAMETAIYADETALGQTSASTFCDISLAGLTTPGTPVVTNAGTAGSTSYTYLVADVGNAGTLAPSTPVTNTSGNATLGTANYNVITFPSIPGHYYNLYRSASSGTPSTTGLITAATPATTYSTVLNDTGLTATGNVPTANTSGALSVTGPIFTASVVALGAAVSTISATAATTLTTANMLQQLINFTNVATTATLPTAAALVAALPGIKVNTGFKFLVRAAGSGSVTLASNTGVTVATGVTLAVVSLHVREYFMQFTGVASGSEAITLYSGADSAF